MNTEDNIRKPGIEDYSLETGEFVQSAVHVTVGQRIRKRRKELNMSVDELAELIGKDRATIYRYEKGEIENMPMTLLQPTAEALGVSISYLIGLDDEEACTGVKSNSLGLKIKNARKAKGLTQEDLGKLLGVEKSAVAKYENGRVVNLKRTTLIKLSEILGCSTAYLMNDEQSVNHESESRSVFAHNLQYYIRVSGRTQKEIAEELGVSSATFCDWVKGKKFPRIDKIELLSEYFGVQKADLIENNCKEDDCELAVESEDDSKRMREVFANNLKMQMIKHGQSRKEVSEALNVSYSTFTDWVTAKKYPRMNKIEALARYFGIEKSDLIEQNNFTELETITQQQDEQIKPIKRASVVNRKKVFAKNLKYYIAGSGKKREDIANDIGISISTLNGWIYANTYPALEKIELLANYFGIPLTHLTTEVDMEKIKTQKTKNEVLDIMLRLHSDSEFFSLVEHISLFNKEQIIALRQMISAFMG